MNTESLVLLAELQLCLTSGAFMLKFSQEIKIYWDFIFHFLDKSVFLTYEKLAFEILIYNQVSEERLEKTKQRVPVSMRRLKGISQGRIQRAQICLYSIHSLCRSPRDLE